MQDQPKFRQRFYVLPLLALAAVLVPSAVLAGSAEGAGPAPLDYARATCPAS